LQKIFFDSSTTFQPGPAKHLSVRPAGCKMQLCCCFGAGMQ
jgi:hypothetical protein